MKALILVDIQNDFLPGGALAVPDGDAIIPIINPIQSKFDLVVASQDWHPQTHKSFASNHDKAQVLDVIDLNGNSQVLWPDHCVQGSEGAQFSEALHMNKVSAIFRKGMDIEVDSYSAFYDNNHSNATGLEPYLKGKGINEVYVCGLAADYCVYYTAKDAKLAGFNTYYLTDAMRYIDQTSYEAALTDLKAHKVHLVETSNL
ncbi:bifunctional nicotinamidase/pyrazinamidase [Mangrovimonas sp. YM274]|uniref:bifunctional nicotinamidase/pyrazinamidase n=1 Tax=Mangrovimonas sp. YM274 TaxID=3070660 RepID=UPI0027DCC4BF|nr:bifunctional nicotinamidase/pyrazinamidase [Mangrovimonas sp. YM274]WMI68973.1 bifunctional nicotinamidase/pyrazinamidase [Mangrovimonas sp. YM274]